MRRGFSSASYRPFLRQVLEEAFHPDRPDCPDMEHTSGGLADLLKTGFSMFMKVRGHRLKPRPL
ncbi:Sec1 family domain-containing protein 2 [Liparis tanakae]|uniref:Sec1 family domain-containing protein 2 n=1 Tax=Liparis tanakae TaxID=230148 RepID=A0A4Z2DZR5_9TELE|nr:Sec1 family domain-containing protein 2 [Liparis tanakae]